MRVETIVKAIKDRQLALQEKVFSGDEANFSRAKGIWLGLGDALSVISEEVKKERNSDED